MIHQLGKREILILKHLINAQRPLSSELLAVILGTSPKTVRNSMSVVNDILKIAGGAKILSKTGSGYTLEIMDENEFRVFMQTFNAKYLDAYWVPNEASERVEYIVRRLLMSETHLKMEQLMEALFISRVTLSKDLREARRLLKTYHLRIEHRAKYGLKIVGKEMHFRVALVDYLDADEDMNNIDDLMHPPLHKYDAKLMTEKIVKLLLSYGVSMSTNSLRKLVKLVTVSEFRRSKGHLIVLSDEDTLNLPSKVEYEIAKAFYQDMWDEIGHIPEREIAFMAIFIISRRNMMKEEPFSVLREALYMDYSKRLLSYLEEKLGLPFLEDKLEVAMAKHLRGMFYRLKYGLEKRDVGILESKGSNPSFEYAVIASDWISEQLGLPVQETEIAYLSYRFYQFYHTLFSNVKSRIMIVLSSGRNAVDLFVEALNASFGSYIERIHSAEIYELEYLDLSGYDVIITDIPSVQFSVEIDVLRVNFFFTEGDIQRLKRYFTNRQLESSQFLSHFDRKLFFSGLKAHNKEEVLDFLSNALLESDPEHDSGVIEAIIKREDWSSTERGNAVALPHNLLPADTTPKIAICVLQHPIIWDKEICQLVLLNIASQHERMPFQTLNLLRVLTGNVQRVYELINARNFDAVMEIMTRFITTYEL